ncbi:hypothetical protein [Amycolatopsis cihanbeyliensis]
MACFYPEDVPAIRIFDRPEGWSEPISGHYDHIGDILVALYRFKGELMLRLGQRDFEVSRIKSMWHLKKDGKRELGLTIRDDWDVKLEYVSQSDDFIDVMDITPFAEEEDFDFGLFINNVVNNPDRSGNIYR